MKLEELLTRLNYKLVSGSIDIEISDVIYDSRKVIKDCVFVCLVGSAADGHKYAADAVKNGAAAVVVSKPADISGAAVIMVDDTRKALAFMSAEYFGNPADTLTTIGITGTKGKTTTASMIRSILEKGNIKTGVIGTLGIIIGDKLIKTNNTTPESYEIQRAMRQMIDEGCKCCVMEASSLGIKWHRTDGFIFDYGIFTNFSHDHIGGVEHPDMEDYRHCKSLLFRQCMTGIMNIDDPAWKDMLEDPNPYYIFALHHLQYYMGYMIVTPEIGYREQKAVQAWFVDLGVILETRRIQRDLELSVDRLRFLYNRDMLTEIYNRRGLEEFFGEYHDECVRNKTGLAVIAFDMDGLKTINDNFGHNEGDYAIKAIAYGLTRSINVNEVCARAGGDEFIVLAKNYTEELAESFIKKVRTVIEQKVMLDGKEFKVEVSSGIHIEYPVDADENDAHKIFERCLKEADQQMYSEKRQHKGG